MSLNEWISKLCYMYTIEHCLAKAKQNKWKTGLDSNMYESLKTLC